MTTTATKLVQGRITVVQETRFRLTTPAGQGFLFILSRAARIAPGDLCLFLERGTTVWVEYTGEPGLASCVARTVREDR